MKEDGMPLRSVFDNRFDIIITAPTATAITTASIAAPAISEKRPVEEPMTNIVIILIIVGNLPLQGISDAVIMAMSLSRLLSIILAPVIPQALHPRLIHKHKACFPQAPDFLNALSRLKAILGKTP